MLPRPRFVSISAAVHLLRRGGVQRDPLPNLTVRGLLEFIRRCPDGSGREAAGCQVRRKRGRRDSRTYYFWFPGLARGTKPEDGTEPSLDAAFKVDKIFQDNVHTIRTMRDDEDRADDAGSRSGSGVDDIVRGLAGIYDDPEVDWPADSFKAMAFAARIGKTTKQGR